jgi:uncharacterized protein
VFSRAYAPASSTVLTLAPSLGCRYDASPKEAPALLRGAQERGMKTALFIPRSAYDYHQGAFPTFRFEHEDVLAPLLDQPQGATAQALVERSVAWLKNENPSRFMLWLYQFDVHEWGGLPDGYVDPIATASRFSKTDGLPWRYRAAARGVDRAFAQLRAALHELGLLDRTVLLFVADHGEALGQQGFWVHTTYLWESLVRVPLAFEVPGLPARRIDTAVSLVDLPTTLSRFIGPLPDEDRCHGEDLLAADDLGRRRLPILMSAVIDGQLARVGMLGEANRKLVVDLREGDARLLELPTEEDVSARDPSEAALMLNRLVRSPIYPRL